MPTRPSFFDSLRRRSFRRTPNQSRTSSSQAMNSSGSINGSAYPSINADGAADISVNGHTTPAPAQAFENNSSLTINTPESNSASPSEVSSSEMNAQAANGNTGRPNTGRPVVNGNRSSTYYMVSRSPDNHDTFIGTLAHAERADVDQYHRASRTLRTRLPLLMLREYRNMPPDLDGYIPPGNNDFYQVIWDYDAHYVQVYQQVLLLTGRIGEDGNTMRTGTLVLYHHKNFLPPMSSRVVESQFKHLVRLQPGPNHIRLEYLPDSRSSIGSSSMHAHTSTILIHCIPQNSSPPLQLAILVASDSNETYDAVPGRVQLEGNNLAMAVRKYRMAAYMWQAFTAENMRRNGFGNRTFRFDEEWQPQTLTCNPAYADRMASEAKVHIIRLPQTMAEIRSMDYAQQNKDAQRKGALYDIAMDACKRYFNLQGNQVQHVAAMFLDTHWDPATKVIRGHAALGGGDGKLQLAIFGSHCLQSYPSSLDEINQAFTDATRTDSKYVGNDCGNCGSSWEAANVGIAAHLHEVGHLFGCPHQENGVMLGDYFGFSRTFCMWEPFATRTGQRAHAIVDRSQESFFHRLDCLRFRFHPAFQRPIDLPLPEDTVQAWAIDRGIALTSSAGIGWIEFYGDGEDLCHHYVEYYNHETGTTKQLKIPLDKLKSELPERLRSSKRLRLEIFSCGINGHVTIDDVYEFVNNGKIRLGSGNRIQGALQGGGSFAFRGQKVGWSQLPGSHPEEVIFLSVGDNTKVMTSIIVYHGDFVDGLEFVYADGETQLFGKRGGKPGGSEFKLDTRLGEQLFGFYLRCGQWIDGLQVWTTRNRKSEMFGNPTGGSGRVITPPLGYSAAGVAGSCGAWLDGFQLLITR